jgi:hypothetical protein
MKISSDTHEKLIIEERPILTGLAIGLVFLLSIGGAASIFMQGEKGGLLLLLISAMAAIAFYAFVRQLSIVFDRETATVEINRKWLGGRSTNRYDLLAIESADVETRESFNDHNNRMRVTSRAILIMKPGHQPQKLVLTEHFSGGSGAERSAKAINAWLGSN